MTNFMKTPVDISRASKTAILVLDIQEEIYHTVSVHLAV